MLRALSDPTRRAIVKRLAAGPQPAGRIASQFPVSLPAISRHLRVLRGAGLVSEERSSEDSRVRVYTLHPEQVDRVSVYADELRTFARAQLAAFKQFAESREGGKT